LARPGAPCVADGFVAVERHLSGFFFAASTNNLDERSNVAKLLVV